MDFVGAQMKKNMKSTDKRSKMKTDKYSISEKKLIAKLKSRGPLTALTKCGDGFLITREKRNNGWNNGAEYNAALKLSAKGIIEILSRDEYSITLVVLSQETAT